MKASVRFEVLKVVGVGFVEVFAATATRREEGAAGCPGVGGAPDLGGHVRSRASGRMERARIVVDLAIEQDDGQHRRIGKTVVK